ncbi:hypothetical protein C6H88_04005 [Chlamydia muridarum str. Nigg]|jgi:hypothetical protein|uniref:Uncharacterized protein n=2 Tax=Chlamydia muridarum TaxID=83560 RepID=A0A069ZUF6_CHLMR|nr:hypothetical protein [Chlamydia muridarum]UFW21326.1 hypothetical protein FTN04_04150 [Chlamydia trachomatis]AAF39580.1 conserved hypothetical protein [Chlamydia muridarum str. Nigg]AHH23163.1 hypothetical protein TAC_04110 [Chlamydia muridarum str. Nigg3 CMUT3-5]AHH24089.1 hypothetical protein Y015_04110 [Chlamydia muridarum str. Nigg CM972]AID38290.1 hypothetical protein BB17_04165 [Chlamydia muridarum str. Nigg 2 MCR]
MLFHIFVGIPIQEEVIELKPPLQMISFLGKKFLGIYSKNAESFSVTEVTEFLKTSLLKLNGVAFRNIQTYQATPVIIPEVLIG